MKRSSNHFQRPIFVLGIPRSGTSLVAGLLKISGAWAGYTVPGGAANPKGFFENVGLRENVSKTILRSMGADPLGVTRLPELDLSATIKGLADQVDGMIRQEGYVGSTPWLFKDAKLTLTWPQWKHAFPDARWVIVRREPEDIIRSCLNTNFMLQHSSDPAFWQRWVDQYLDRLERLKEADVWWREISAHAIAGGDFGETRRLVEDLELHWDEQAISAFVDPDAWHAKKEGAAATLTQPASAAAFAQHPEPPVAAELAPQQQQLMALRSQYQQACQRGSSDANAWFTLAIIEAQLGEMVSAERCCKKAIELNPGFAEAYSNLGILLQNQGRSDEAAAAYTQALSINPRFAEAHNNLGNLLEEQQRWSEAEEQFRQALACNPDYPDAHNNLGAVLEAQGRVDDALLSYQQAIAANNSFLGAHMNLAAAYESQGKLDEAVAALVAVQQAHPQAIDLYKQLAALYVKQGSAESALALYRQALRSVPDTTSEAEIHFNVGVLLEQMEHREEAQVSYAQALQVNPQLAQAHLNIGNILITQSRLDEAFSRYQLALRIKPDLAMAHSNLGHMLRRRNEIDAAAASYRQALQIDPEIAAAHFNLGKIHMQREQFQPAFDCFQQVSRIAPQRADGYKMQAQALLRMERLDEAAAAYQYALRTAPTDAEAHFGLGVVLENQQQLDSAQASYRQALSIAPGMVAALQNLGNVLHKQQHLDAAVECYQDALAEQPAALEVRNNLGNVLLSQGKCDAALECYQQGLESDPENVRLHYNIAIALEKLGRHAAALERYQHVLELQPDYGDAWWNMALLQLRMGDFANGWDNHEWGLKRQERTSRLFPFQPWQGEPLQGRSILIYGEQGIGDEIMFASCIPDLIATGATCYIECEPRLAALFSRAFTQAQVINNPRDGSGWLEALGEVDFQVAIGSLPRYFRPSLESFSPRRQGYLTASAVLRDKWRARYAQLGTGMKVGISWRGGRKALPEIQQQRTTTLAQWAELFEVGAGQLHFIDLQYGEHRAELATAEQEQGITLHHWADADPLKDLDDFAAQIAALDLVISVDNSTVHFAGGLAVPVWVLLPFEHDWRWMVAREESHWYGAVRLFHQHSQGEWPAVFRQVATALAEKLAQHSDQGADGNDSAAEVG